MITFERWELDEYDDDQAHPVNAGPDLILHGIPMHIFAYRVREDRGEDPWGQTELSKIEDLLGGGGPLTTTKLPGLEGSWTIVCLPYGS